LFKFDQRSIVRFALLILQVEPVEVYRWAEMMASRLNRQVIDALVVKAAKVLESSLSLSMIGRSGSVFGRVSDPRLGSCACVCRMESGAGLSLALGLRWEWPTFVLQHEPKKVEVAAGLDPNETKREVARAAVHDVLSRRNLCDVLDQYQTTKLSELRRGANVRRAIDGKRGLLQAFVNQDIASSMRDDALNAVRLHAKRAPIAAKRCLAYVSAFFNWCVGQGILEASHAATVKAFKGTRARSLSFDQRAARNLGCGRGAGLSVRPALSPSDRFTDTAGGGGCNFASRNQTVRLH
jgi:hypothetical protein